MEYRSREVALRAQGPLAVFTASEFKVERVSVPVITPTAARGLFSAILWKPAIEWQVTRVQVLAPIRFTSFRRNEVNSRVPTISAKLARNGGPAPFLVADEDRAQRNTIALCDVDYVIEARIVLTPKAGPGDNIRKFEDMFLRRLEKGQHFSQPYFGCREFAASVTPADGAPEPLPINRKLGRILWDIEYVAPGGKVRSHFFDAELVNGVMEIPPSPTIQALEAR